jgi:hypothetical protein
MQRCAAPCFSRAAAARRCSPLFAACCARPSCVIAAAAPSGPPCAGSTAPGAPAWRPFAGRGCRAARQVTACAWHAAEAPSPARGTLALAVRTRRSSILGAGAHLRSPCCASTLGARDGARASDGASDGAVFLCRIGGHLAAVLPHCSAPQIDLPHCSCARHRLNLHPRACRLRTTHPAGWPSSPAPTGGSAWRWGVCKRQTGALGRAGSGWETAAEGSDFPPLPPPHAHQPGV